MHTQITHILANTAVRGRKRMLAAIGALPYRPDDIAAKRALMWTLDCLALGPEQTATMDIAYTGTVYIGIQDAETGDSADIRISDHPCVAGGYSHDGRTDFYTHPDADIHKSSKYFEIVEAVRTMTSEFTVHLTEGSAETARTLREAHERAERDAEEARMADLRARWDDKDKRREKEVEMMLEMRRNVDGILQNEIGASLAEIEKTAGETIHFMGRYKHRTKSAKQRREVSQTALAGRYGEDRARAIQSIAKRSAPLPRFATATPEYIMDIVKRREGAQS